MLNKVFIQLIIVILLTQVLSSNSSTFSFSASKKYNIEYSEGSASSKKDVVANPPLISPDNCYIIKPVANCSEYYWPNNLVFPKKSLDAFLNEVIKKGKIKYDRDLRFVTSFDYQKEVFFNYDCFNKLSTPDSCGLMGIYLNSSSGTKNMTKSIIEFIGSYKKRIYKIGETSVFEYRFNDVAEVEPHFLHLILKEPSSDDKRYGRDIKGFALCSDGIEWKDYNSMGKFSIPLFVQKVRRSKEFYIPLYYDGQRFIPIGHFKSNLWE